MAGEIRATPRNQLLGLLADTLQGGSNFASKPFGYDNPPVRGLLDLLPVQAITNTLNELSYGGALGTGSGMTYRPKADTLDAAMAVAPMLGGAPRAINAGAAAIGQRLEPSVNALVNRTMVQGGRPAQLLQDMAQGTQSNVYLPHTPLKPNPLVGTRYETEFVGNMAPKTPRRIEELQGASLLAMPWDSTSRGYAIKSISGERLPNQFVTDGGQDFARDLANINANVAGASGESIASRIQDRVRIASRENQHFGGNGNVYSLPNTMAAEGEYYSTQPTDALLNLIQKQDLSNSQINQINEWTRNAVVQTPSGPTRPFSNFAGVEKDAGLMQFITGEGLGDTAGELRKAFTKQMTLDRGQQMLGYNKLDLTNALTDPALLGVPKGYAGNTIIKSDPFGSLTPSSHPSYDTNFPGQYFGSLLDNIPIEYLMPKTYRSLAEEMEKRGGHLRTNVIGAMEKRKAGISEIVDQQVIDSVNKYLGR